MSPSDPRLELVPSPKPCGECPFRRASMPGWLGSNAPADFIVAISTEQPLPCHSSIDYADPEWRDKFMAGEEGRLCAGSLIMSANMCKRPRDPKFPQRPADRELVFANHLEFMAHHENAPVRSWETEDSYEIREPHKRGKKMIEPGQICRDNTRKTFRIVIVLEPSSKDGKLRVCRWQPSPNPQVVDGHWSVPCALHEHQLDPLPADFDLSTRRGQVVSQAKRSVINGLVCWNVGRASFPHPPPTEVHNVGKVRP